MSSKKVLVVGINPWIDNTGINTLIDFFDGWDKNSLAHLYTREKLPGTQICDNFFRISEPRVLKSLWNPAVKTGEKVYNSSTAQTQQENAIYQKKAGVLKQLLRELVWKFGKWKTPELDSFLHEFDPDVLFFPVYSYVYMCRLQNYIAKKLNKPIVLYSSDDNFSYLSVVKTPFSLLHRFWLRHQEKKLFQRAGKILVISPKQKEEYDRLFHTNCSILTKGIDFSSVNFFPQTLHNPLKMVYTGKLIIGRWRSLAAIADALGEINRQETKLELDIYTTDKLTKEQEVSLNRNGSAVKGKLSLSEVKKIQQDADVLVFVESLEKEYRYAARLSFSTKITDYLQCGKCIFAIGDTKIAPIDYFMRYDCAITATSNEEIAQKLNAIVIAPEQIAEYAKKAFDCGKKHHDKNTTRRILIDAIENVR